MYAVRSNYTLTRIEVKGGYGSGRIHCAGSGGGIREISAITMSRTNVATTDNVKSSLLKLVLCIKLDHLLSVPFLITVISRGQIHLP